MQSWLWSMGTLKCGISSGWKGSCATPQTGPGRVGRWLFCAHLAMGVARSLQGKGRVK